MKKLVSTMVLAFAGLLAGGRASAQVRSARPYLQYVQYSQPPVAVAAVYLVNGVNYPVDYAGGIWARNAWGAWFVIGHIEHTAYGDIAVRNDGMRFTALWVR